MSKETNAAVYKDDKTIYTASNPDNGPDDLVRRPGKTRRDHESGAWDNHLHNRQAKIDENRGHGGKK